MVGVLCAVEAAASVSRTKSASTHKDRAHKKVPIVDHVTYYVLIEKHEWRVICEQLYYTVSVNVYMYQCHYHCHVYMPPFLPIVSGILDQSMQYNDLYSPKDPEQGKQLQQ